MIEGDLLKDYISFSRDDHFLVHKDYMEILKRNGLFSSEKLLNYKEGEKIKDKGVGRATNRFYLNWEDKSVGFYLKLYNDKKKSPIIKRKRRAKFEWENIINFRLRGLPTILPVAFGHGCYSDGSYGSFILSKELTATVTLESFLLKLSSQYEDKKRYLIKKKLIKSLAGLTFKMHKAGFNHKDFYLCHILINMDDKGESFRLYIVDLHRANLNGRVKLYFRIKDLAALNYSAPKGIINRSDKLLFYKAYQGKGNYTLYDKFVIWCILKKSQKIFRHERKKIEV